MTCQNPASRGGIDCTGTRQNFRTDVNVPYHNCGGSYETVYICQNSQNCKNWQILLYVNLTPLKLQEEKSGKVKGNNWAQDLRQMLTSAFSNSCSGKGTCFSNMVSHICQFYVHLPESECFSGESTMVGGESSAAAESWACCGCICELCSSHGLPSADCCVWIREM